MLGYFPKPYPDEIFYSVLCRLKVHLGLLSSNDLSSLAYGDKTIPSNINFPVNLQGLMGNLPVSSNIDFEDMLFNHSILNYYLPFISDKKYSSIKEGIIQRSIVTGKLDSILGVTSSKVPSPSHLKFCKKCLLEDNSTFGEPYYHRAHQLPGVMLCHKHYIPLSYTKYKFKSKLREECLCPLTLDVEEIAVEKISDSMLDFARYIAEESYYLLSNTMYNHGIPYLRNKYIDEFIKQNLATFNRHSNHTEIQNLMDNKIPKDFMTNFCINNKDNYWLVYLTGGGDKVSIHPLRLICLNYALGINMEQVFSGIDKYNPFGEPPWLCLNPVCPHYKKYTITDVTLRTNSKDNNPLGIFKCPHCDYTFMRKGHDEEKVNLTKKSRVVNYGDLFKERLLYLVDVEGISFNSLSHNYFDGMDGKALKMWYERWKNDDVSANKLNDEIEANKQFWIQKLKEYPNKTRHFFQEAFPSEYRFCYKHITNWFEDNFPKTVEPVSKHVSFHVGVKSRLLDWEKIDLEYSEQLKKAIDMFKKQYPNSRASYAAIERILGKHNYCVRLKDKMPISFKLLNDFVQSTSHFKLYYFNL